MIAASPPAHEAGSEAVAAQSGRVEALLDPEHGEAVVPVAAHRGREPQVRQRLGVPALTLEAATERVLRPVVGGVVGDEPLEVGLGVLELHADEVGPGAQAEQAGVVGVQLERRLEDLERLLGRAASEQVVRRAVGRLGSRRLSRGRRRAAWAAVSSFMPAQRPLRARDSRAGRRAGCAGRARGRATPRG